MPSHASAYTCFYVYFTLISMYINYVNLDEYNSFECSGLVEVGLFVERYRSVFMVHKIVILCDVINNYHFHYLSNFVNLLFNKLSFLLNHSRNISKMDLFQYKFNTSSEEINCASLIVELNEICVGKILIFIRLSSFFMRYIEYLYKNFSAYYKINE